MYPNLFVRDRARALSLFLSLSHTYRLEDSATHQLARNLECAAAQVSWRVPRTCVNTQIHVHARTRTRAHAERKPERSERE